MRASSSKLSASSLSNQGGVGSTVLVGLPLLMEVPGVAWVAITEANLRDYTAMYLTNAPGGWTSHKFECRLAPHLDDPGNGRRWRSSSRIRMASAAGGHRARPTGLSPTSSRA